MNIKGLNLVAVKRSLLYLGNTAQRYHITIITVAILSTIIIAVAQVNAILSQPPDEDYRESITQKSLQTSFDKATIEAINNLRQREDTSNLTLPSGRINPFTE